jgi:UDP-N-acetylglucosamine 1-carboxyvinyltransferase
MDKIVIEGGIPLKGEISVSGSKNAALPILMSSLLTKETCKYHNVPKLKDIESTKALLKNMGAEVSDIDDYSVSVNAKGLCEYETSYDLVRKMRASVLVLGPLIARLKKARVSLPGGCAIGARPIDLHLKGLAKLGADISINHGYIEASCDRLKGDDIYLDFPTVTGTENIMMAASLAIGTTIIRNCAKEPEINALAEVLNKMGADIKGAGDSVVTINGVSELNSIETSIMPDRIEAGTFMIAGAITKGDILIKNCEPDHMRAIIAKLKQTGCEVHLKNNSIRVIGGSEIVSANIDTAPYPGFPTDMQAQFMALMTIANGASAITENVFENRMIHVGELDRMGADIKIKNANTAIVTGVKNLSGAPVMATDLRASASLILAGLMADGITEVNRVYHLDRGYEKIEKKFAALGAAIKRVASKK